MITRWIDQHGDRFAVASTLALVGCTLLTMGVGLMASF